MQKRIWKEYNKRLVQRGSVTFLIEKKTLDLIKNYKPKSTGGRPQEFPPTLIELLLLVKIQYSLTYRALEGFAKSIFERIKRWFKIPNYTTICKRAKEIAAKLPRLSSRRPTVVLVDASGIKVYGEGEWKRKVHGVGRPRKWMKMHIAVDEKTQEVIAEELTDCRVADSSMLPELIERTPRSVKKVKADGAYDRSKCRNAIKERGAEPVIPPPRNGRLSKQHKERDEAIVTIHALGLDEKARSLWGKLTGYNYRVLVETAFSRYKRLFSGSLFSKTPDRQKVENRLKWCILNKMISG